MQLQCLRIFNEKISFHIKEKNKRIKQDSINVFLCGQQYIYDSSLGNNYAKTLILITTDINLIVGFTFTIIFTQILSLFINRIFIFSHVTPRLSKSPTI